MKLTIYSDGGSRGNPGPAGAGVVVRDEGGGPVLEAGYYLGQMTNNMAEYHGLLRGLVAAEKHGATDLQIFCDSELLVRQINGEYRVRNEALKDLFAEAMERLQRIGRWKIQHIRREGNSRADALANLAMDAREDVIEIAAGSVSRVPDDEGTAVRVLVRCVKTPDSAVCPAPCRAFTEYSLYETTPTGLCLYPAAAIFGAWQRAIDGSPGLDIECPNQCGGRFHVEREH